MTTSDSRAVNKALVAWLAVAGWMAIIFLFSHQAYSGAVTEAYLHDANIPVRKLAHITEFAVLFLLLRHALSQSRFASEWSGRRLSVAAYLFALANALFDEWHQSLVPGRSSTLSDCVVDMSGAMLAWLAIYAIIKFKK